MDLDEYATAFLLYAPARDPHVWELNLAHLGEALRGTFPHARYKIRQDDGADGEQRLSFWAATDGGAEYDGSATVYGRDCILLTDNTADQAAEFIHWLREGYLPSPAPIRFSTEVAVERGIETDWRVPAEGGVERIGDELKQHIRTVAGPEG